MFDLREIGPATYLMPQTEGMRVPGLVIATEALLSDLEMEKPLQQVRNVAHLAGIVGYSIAMPDIHWGYGFPIGGVAAMDVEEGVISPGGVGYDINCGVRVAIVPIPFRSLSDQQRHSLLERMFNLVPSGVGRGHRRARGLSDHDYRGVAEKGARWSVEQGFGFEADLEACESNGCIEGADVATVSATAKSRGANQLGSIGSGNHFVEVGEIGEIFYPEVAQEWNLAVGQTYVLIHSGSRGFGHQVCTETLSSFFKQGFAKELPDRQLVAAPIKSAAGRQYFAAMATAANFAFNNRQQILHEVRVAFSQVLSIAPDQIPLLYDVAHNIAKFEDHLVEGKVRRLCVHRKGATRAFGPGAEELSPRFAHTGQPVLVPGDMGRASHILVGRGNPITCRSCCHGAGRQRSRVKSSHAWRGRDPKRYMREQGVEVMATSMKTITEEMPDAYKDVDEVVRAVKLAGLADPVARLLPRAVVKG
jgi:tRNA-splicing ligase RtcB (3'-phosphate/5'-hydroxy nucleic acid ligase)